MICCITFVDNEQMRILASAINNSIIRRWWIKDLVWQWREPCVFCANYLGGDWLSTHNTIFRQHFQSVQKIHTEKKEGGLIVNNLSTLLGRMACVWCKNVRVCKKDKTKRISALIFFKVLSLARVHKTACDIYLDIIYLCT